MMLAVLPQVEYGLAGEKQQEADEKGAKATGANVNSYQPRHKSSHALTPPAADYIRPRRPFLINRSAAPITDAAISTATAVLYLPSALVMMSVGSVDARASP